MKRRYKLSLVIIMLMLASTWFHYSGKLFVFSLIIRGAEQGQITGEFIGYDKAFNNIGQGYLEAYGPSISNTVDMRGVAGYDLSPGLKFKSGDVVTFEVLEYEDKIVATDVLNY